MKYGVTDTAASPADGPEGTQQYALGRFADAY